jgi:hypothetical protein
MLGVTNKPIMLSIVMLNVVMLSVVVPDHIKCSWELVHSLAAKTMALLSGAKIGVPWVSTLYFLRTLCFEFM